MLIPAPYSGWIPACAGMTGYFVFMQQRLKGMGFGAAQNVSLFF